jgi:hypothetical protein
MPWVGGVWHNLRKFGEHLGRPSGLALFDYTGHATNIFTRRQNMYTCAHMHNNQISFQEVVYVTPVLESIHVYIHSDCINDPLPVPCFCPSSH